MPERDELHKEGLPPRERNADVPQQTNRPIIWMAGVIVVCAIVALALFGTTRMTDTTASNPGASSETTTGSAPAQPPKGGQ